MQTLSVVENEGFIKLVKELHPRYQLPSLKYEKLKGTVRLELTQVEHVALTKDLWTSNQTLTLWHL